MESEVRAKYKDFKGSNLPAKSIWKKMAKSFPDIPLNQLKNICAKAS